MYALFRTDCLQLALQFCRIFVVSFSRHVAGYLNPMPQTNQLKSEHGRYTPALASFKFFSSRGRERPGAGQLFEVCQSWSTMLALIKKKFQGVRLK